MTSKIKAIREAIGDNHADNIAEIEAERAIETKQEKYQQQMNDHIHCKPRETTRQNDWKSKLRNKKLKELEEKKLKTTVTNYERKFDSTEERYKYEKHVVDFKDQWENEIEVLKTFKLKKENK